MEFSDVFEHHVIKRQTDRSWYCARPGTTQYWFEVFVTVNGCLFVHGDIESVFLWGPCYDSPQDVLRKYATADVHYVHQKARMGLNATNVIDGVVSEFDADTWLRHHPDDPRCAGDVLIAYHNAALPDVRDGATIAPRVYYAHKAIQKLVELCESSTT